MQPSWAPEYVLDLGGGTVFGTVWGGGDGVLLLTRVKTFTGGGAPVLHLLLLLPALREILWTRKRKILW